MKPRVFVSSTYYDLKYVRENIEHFIMQYGFDAVLFESGRVTFEYGKDLDISCYQEVESCHIMVLIVGGRYGSIASNENPIEKMDRYDKEFTSITKREFETAQKNKIPIFIFIDKNVYAEFQTFKSNEAFFAERKDKNSKNELIFKFAHADSINVFKFIDSLTHNAIKTFEKAEEITDYLRLQLAGMFFLYLDQLKKNSNNNEILNSVNQLQNTASKIDTIVDAIARQIMDETQFKAIEEKQFRAVSAIFADSVPRYVDFDIPYSEEEIRDTLWHDMANIFMTQLFDQDFKLDSTEDYRKFNNQISDKILKALKSLHPKLNFTTFYLLSLYRQYKTNVEPFINTDEKRALFVRDLTGAIYSRYLPF